MQPDQLEATTKSILDSIQAYNADQLEATTKSILDSIQAYNAKLMSATMSNEAERHAGVINSLTQALLNLRNARK